MSWFSREYSFRLNGSHSHFDLVSDLLEAVNGGEERMAIGQQPHRLRRAVRPVWRDRVNKFLRIS